MPVFGTDGRQAVCGRHRAFRTGARTRDSQSRASHQKFAPRSTLKPHIDCRVTPESKTSCLRVILNLPVPAQFQNVYALSVFSEAAAHSKRPTDLFYQIDDGLCIKKSGSRFFVSALAIDGLLHEEVRHVEQKGGHMRRLLLALAALGIATNAHASCRCACMGGSVKPICTYSYELAPICPPNVCIVEPPSVAPIARPIIPPIGTQNCHMEQVGNPNTGQYSWKQVCR